MASMMSSFQDRVKTSTNAMALFGLKTLSGTVVGLTLALIGDEIINYGWFSFSLVIIVTTAALLKTSKSWSWTQIAIFDLFCVLTGLILHMYILIAPG
jgi:hypothetical protein